MPTPTNVVELQRALGMVTFLGRFISNLSARTAPLRSLLQKDIDWQWRDEHEVAWTGLKETLSGHPVLTVLQREQAAQDIVRCL